MAITLEPPCLPAHLPVANQVLVTIAVVDGELICYPARENDVVVFHRNPGFNPARPNSVRWVVTGLSPGEKIVIGPKPDQPDMFDEIHPITYGNNTVCSGSPKEGPGPGASVIWRYNISLWKSNQEKPSKVLDPEVEIKEDP